jgi:siroheme synthase
VVVVPGITAALGAAASTGIPLTQRGVSQSVTFVTATGAQGDSLDWRALAGPLQTVVFYMGVGQLDEVVTQLSQHGLPAAHPVALVERATWPDQRVLHGTLGGLLALAQSAALQSPTLLVVGEVTALGLQAAVTEQQIIKSGGERA